MEKLTWFEKYVFYPLKDLVEAIFAVFSNILGIIFIVIMIIVWLGFFGIIPQGTPSEDAQCSPDYYGASCN